MSTPRHNSKARPPWFAVIFAGIAVAALLLSAAAMANEPVRHFASCDPPAGHRLIHIQPGSVYVCPRAYTREWDEHVHAGLVRGLQIAAMAVLVGTAVLALGLSLRLRRRSQPIREA